MTFPEMLEGVCRELARIMACYHLDQARDSLHDFQVIADLKKWERESLEGSEKELEEGMDKLGCPSFGPK